MRFFTVAVAGALTNSVQSLRKVGRTEQNCQCAEFERGSPPSNSPDEADTPFSTPAYHTWLAEKLDVEKLYRTIEEKMKTSQDCWPADGPQDGDVASYAGLFQRLAWHCSGTLKRINDGEARGGCEGGNIRFWPEREWGDNGNLDQARALLAQVKAMDEFKEISWGDLMTFAGTVGIKASGGPVNKFCFGRIDNRDGFDSLQLGSEGIEDCDLGNKCISTAPCDITFQYDEQDPNDHAMCNDTQPNNRFQASHRVGNIYVYPEGPQLKTTAIGFNPNYVHQRSPRLSAMDVRDTFSRMGWNDSETVALIGGGHTLGRTHGNCPNVPSGGKCVGAFTTTSGFEGAWTTTPSKWNYEYFTNLFMYKWVPTKSPEDMDQWGISDPTSPAAKTMRLTADMALINDRKYEFYANQFEKDHDQFNKAFASAWFTLVHNSERHPGDNNLENDAGKCTTFDFLS